MKSLKKTPIELLSYLQLTDAVIITDSNHVILDVNKEYESTTGYSSESITGLRAGFLKSRLTPQSTYTSLKCALKEKNLGRVY
ncbi:PAS domain S-box protein [Peribacillus sp. NPDC097295]|uniref:PAS domain S-box protein n=1 Tax=Peribacillus sp. NPDC097295 TaxID=3364402 RepID=UPI00381F26CE